MDDIVSQNLEVASPGVDPDVGVTGRVLDGAVVGLARVGLVGVVHALALELAHEAEVHEERLVLSIAEAQEDVLRLHVIVDVALRVNVLQHVDLSGKKQSELLRLELNFTSGDLQF